jgi:Flp pilus assembly protein TadB
MRETIRRIRKRKTWVNPTGWEMNKGKLIILTGGSYLLALIALLNGGIVGSIVLATIAILLTTVYVGTERQLRNRFKDIEEKFRTQTKDK